MVSGPAACPPRISVCKVSPTIAVLGADALWRAVERRFYPGSVLQVMRPISRIDRQSAFARGDQIRVANRDRTWTLARCIDQPILQHLGPVGRGQEHEPFGAVPMGFIRQQVNHRSRRGWIRSRPAADRGQVGDISTAQPCWYNLRHWLESKKACPARAATQGTPRPPGIARSPTFSTPKKSKR